ncbi:hypothetical protein [Fodinibius halophilus]|uniref:Uncharacterized protein n=1 Tax=Fodinibius halophilus TaxID=1736908 RepID=A0A6M1T3B5_9BACT|nr:hypothetical protein [Fodinibius halophilus]NGP87113.1 hypothetical protein [Fodinibius halophilus]
MSAENTLQRLRQFLLLVVAAIFIGTIFELILLGHTEESQQWIPFIASFLGLVMIGWVWKSATENSLKTLRWIMLGICLVSLLGMYFHFSGNFFFALEINPSMTWTEAIWPAMTGSYPFLAPGILFLAGILGIAATYRHPELLGQD